MKRSPQFTSSGLHPCNLRCPICNVIDFNTVCFLFLALIPFLALATAQLPAQDTLILKNGRKADCHILDFTADSVKITYRSTPTSPFTERLVPLVDVDYAELAPLPGEAEALATAIRENRSEPLISFWIKRLAWLGHPRTNSGEIGLTYAELLSRTASADRLDRALKIYQQIETGDWSAERRGRAQAGKLRLMLRQGRVSEVRPLAESLLEKSGDPRVLIELRHVMAEASAAALTQLEKDHPRWPEEDDLGPRHEQLLNDALDDYLYPHLFHGAEEDLAARGLWAAAQLCATQKLNTQATEWSTDLTNLYSTTPEATAAQTWLQKQPTPVSASTARSALLKATIDNKDDSEEISNETLQTNLQPVKSQPKAKPALKPKPKAKIKTTKEAADG